MEIFGVIVRMEGYYGSYHNSFILNNSDTCMVFSLNNNYHLHLGDNGKYTININCKTNIFFNLHQYIENGNHLIFCSIFSFLQFSFSYLHRNWSIFDNMIEPYADADFTSWVVVCKDSRYIKKDCKMTNVLIDATTIYMLYQIPKYVIIIKIAK